MVRPDEHVRDHRDRPRDRDHVAGDELAAGVARDQPVVDGNGGEEQEVDDRVAEPPEDVLREQDVRLSDECIDCMICQMSNPASGSVAMIMSTPITASGITAYGTLRSFVAKVRGIRKPQPNEMPEPLPDRSRDAVERLAVRDRVEDREAPGHDREPREQDGEREEAGRPVAPVARPVEGQRIEEDPGRPKAHEERRHDHAEHAEHHQPPGEARHPDTETAHRETDTREHPVGQPHDGEPGPADECTEAVRRHHRVPEVVTDASLGHGLAPAEEHAEQSRGREDQRRRLQIAGRQAARDLQGALVAHAGFTTNVASSGHGPRRRTRGSGRCRRPAG